MSQNINSSSADKMRFEFQIAEIQGHRVLVVSGEIDVYTSPQFKLAVMSVLNDNVHELIINMHNIKYLDSSGLGILIFTTRRPSPDKVAVHLVGCNSTVVRVLQIMKLTSIITLHDNMDDALKALSA